MTAQSSPTLANIEVRAPAWERLAPLVGRYGMSALGPLSVSGSHFAASLLVLHLLSRAEFGLFSFLLVVVPFCLSLSGMLLGVSFGVSMARSVATREAETATHLKANLCLSALAGATIFAIMLTLGAKPDLAAILGLYAGTMSLRSFARSFSYTKSKVLRTMLSDLVYSMVLMGSLVTLAVLHRFTMFHAAEFLLLSAGLGLLSFGPSYLKAQFWPGRAGSLWAYAGTWRDLSRWAALGVLLTELTANVHAYLVTFISGPAAFAVLALGGLLMRPVSLVLAALPDMERPKMARHIAAGDIAGAFRSVKEFRTAAGAIWLATILMSGALLIWFPHLVLKKGYDETQAIMVVVLWAAIMAVRTLRTPESVCLQAAGQFRLLAGASGWSSVVSLVATLSLLLVWGPIASLGGILAGDLMFTGRIFALTRKWKLGHG